ncbi:hypothetical protein ACFSQP_11140 [Bizionia sediminis]|uniref:Glycerophosphoryl diester phosphodiesterase membrane domain-containing protein n=1 Tax=Bizionia sediminis TaxID=1737064 RepID=A0ABW5KWF8_9FLAO
MMQTVLQKIAQAPTLDFGTLFNEALNLFKKTWLQGFLLQVFTAMLLLPIILVFYIPLLGVVMAQATSGHPDSEAMAAYFAGFSFFYLAFFGVGLTLISVLVIALNAGFFRIMKRLDHNEAVLTRDFFYYFKAAYLGKILLIMLATVLISLLAVLLCVLPVIYVAVPIYFFTIVFAFNPELSVSQIITVSFKLGNKKWLLVFGLTIVASFLAQIVGFLLCGVGLLFTAPFVWHPMYLVYKHVVGFPEEQPVAVME